MECPTTGSADSADRTPSAARPRSKAALTLMLGGELPFKGKVLTDLLIAHRSEQPKPLTEIPPAQWSVIATALKKDPKERFQRAEDMRREMTAAQAAAWNMEAGFGVQFVELSQAQREAVRQLLAGLPLKAEPAAKVESEDPRVSESLQNICRRLQGDHYYLLGLGMEADFPTIRVKGRELTTQLDALRSRGLTGNLCAQLDAATARLQQALDTMLSPAKRAEYDARRGNYRGVVQCLAAGLTATELQALRDKFQAEHTGPVSKAHVLMLTAAGFEKSGAKAQAKDHYEKALGLDPLNLDLLRRYETLRRGAPQPRQNVS